jgi:hypothetical protein
VSGEVVAGFFSFTEILAGEHRSYNEWHMLDHMPEQYAIPGVAWGQRWVSTPACRAARAVSRPALDDIHYLTLYLMTEPLADTLHEFYALGRHLHEVDRFHRQRRSRLSGPFTRKAIAAAERVLVRPEVIPFRPNRGVYVVVGGAIPADAVALPGVAGVWSFSDDQRIVSVAFLDDDPVAVATASAVELLPGGDVEFAGPFETITPWEWSWFD